MKRDGKRDGDEGADGAEGESQAQELAPGTVRTGSPSLTDLRATNILRDSDAAVATSDIPISTRGLRRIARKAANAERLMRFSRALSAGTTTLAVALFGAAATLACVKTGVLHDPVAKKVFIALASSPLLVAAIAWLRRLPPYAGAIALDKEASLNGRMATALAFAKEPSPTPLMRAAIGDAVEHVERVRPLRAAPIAFPSDLLAVVALAGVCFAISVLEIRKHTPVASSPTVSSLEVSQDDLDAMADFGRQLLDNPHADAEMKAAIEEYNKLVEDLKNKRIDRNEAFRRMALLDQKLQKAGELDKKALDEAMKKLGSELKKNELTKDIGTALEKGDKKDAEKKMKELSAKLQNKDLKMSDEQKQKLADALKKAANRDREKNLAAIKAERDKISADLERMRAEKEKNGGKETAEAEKERKEKERQLDRLDREEKQQQSGDRQLDKLDRDLAKAAEDIMKDMGLSGQDLDAGAEDVNKMAEDEMTAEEKEELRQRLRELHDLLVQQGKLSPEQIEKLKQFAKKAKGAGKSKGKGKKKKPGKPGEFDPNADPNGDGDDKGDDGDGDDKDGDGDKDGGKGQKWTIGPNGEKIPMPGSGPPGPGNKPGDQPGGHQAGTGHDPTMGKKTSNKVATVDTQVSGVSNPGGPSRSKVILGAADKGFTGQGYKQVYSEYKTVAESALKADEIPAGYRFYVRRYFDLI